MPENTPPEGKTIYVTAKLKTTDETSGSGGSLSSFLSYAASIGESLFDQVGGGQTVQTVDVQTIGDDVIIRLPGISYPFVVPQSDYSRMSASQRGAMFKLFNEFHQSDHMQTALNHMSSEQIARVIVHYASHPYDVNNVQHGDFDAGETGRIVYEAFNSSGTDMRAGGTVVITINSSLVTSATEFARALAHELTHPFLPGINGADEFEAESWENTIFNDIFSYNGTLETDLQSYADSTTTIGSVYSDSVTGTAGNDTIAGFEGNDSLNGGAGDDLVMGGTGMDSLSGGLGSNEVLGGLDADAYFPAVGVTHEQVEDVGGVDRLDLSSVSINNVYMVRIGDDLLITAEGIASDGIGVSGQWIAANKIEQFTFAEGTFAATYIESLAGVPSGVCYDDMGNPMFCSPYGMPVVLDLDGDGVELIDIRQSHVRFDVNSDGSPERVGWVSGDDGILALDRNGNGRIDDFSEISFRADFRGAGSDLEGLYAYDSNHDGFLTAADTRFGEFLIWRDVNQNGHSESKELFTLAELGIVSIGLERGNIHPLDRHADANQIVATSNFATADGALHILGDVALFADVSVNGRSAYSPAGEFAHLIPEPAYG